MVTAPLLRRIKRAALRGSAALLVSLTIFAIAELLLRAWKSVSYDGVLWLRSASINSDIHPRYGWISPAGRHYEKSDACYGSGPVSYNSAGFRAREPDQTNRASLRICILGDSTMQGFQLPDGQHLPPQLESALARTRSDGEVSVLPLAVGGYGTLQQYMLYEDYCLPFKPQLLIAHWSENDPINNSFVLERASLGDNNLRPRPYLELDGIHMKAPYPFHINPNLDDFLTFKLANTFAMKFSAEPAVEQRDAAEKKGWETAELLYRKIAAGSFHKIALVPEASTRARVMFENLGYKLATYRPFIPEEMCLPRDTHPNAAGHQVMLQALLPVVEEALNEQ